jgi:hypothetical protein
MRRRDDSQLDAWRLAALCEWQDQYWGMARDLYQEAGVVEPIALLFGPEGMTSVPRDKASPGDWRNAITRGLRRSHAKMILLIGEGFGVEPDKAEEALRKAEEMKAAGVFSLDKLPGAVSLLSVSMETAWGEGRRVYARTTPLEDEKRLSNSTDSGVYDVEGGEGKEADLLTSFFPPCRRPALPDVPDSDLN